MIIAKKGDIVAVVELCEAEISPREDGCNAFTIVTPNCREYDERHYNFAVDTTKPCYRFPLYLYRHSGDVLSLNPFSCSWDSGQIGYMVAEKASFDGLENPEEKAREAAECEIAEYNKYLSGEVYCYRIENTKTGEEIDSCYDFYFEGDAIESAKETFADATRNVLEQGSLLDLLPS